MVMMVVSVSILNNLAKDTWINIEPKTTKKTYKNSSRNSIWNILLRFAMEERARQKTIIKYIPSGKLSFSLFNGLNSEARSPRVVMVRITTTTWSDFGTKRDEAPSMAKIIIDTNSDLKTSGRFFLLYKPS